ncbi:MAG: biotin--[acetyl-CoA-carboxylase] ligase [Bacteroidetes bacterium]|nr:biotin--[acetyl-CoA-carboxylase] ligase [Bacteroidota bacterium]
MRTISNTIFIGKILYSLENIPSTNAWVQEFINTHEAVEGMTVIAANQNAGKGQQGKRWESEPGKNLLVSILLKPAFMEVKSLFFFNKAIALAVMETIRRFTDKQVWIKWPNDILIEENKVAGILIETSIQGNKIKNCIVGVGANVNQLYFNDLPNATSLAITEKSEFELQDIFEELCMQIEKYYFILREKKLKEVDTLYHASLYRKNILSAFKTENHFFEGIITGVNNEGKLIISVNGSEQKFSVKEITFL